jgi:hypothetical protein
MADGRFGFVAARAGTGRVLGPGFLVAAKSGGTAMRRHPRRDALSHGTKQSLCQPPVFLSASRFSFEINMLAARAKSVPEASVRPLRHPSRWLGTHEACKSLN